VPLNGCAGKLVLGSVPLTAQSRTVAMNHVAIAKVPTSQALNRAEPRDEVNHETRVIRLVAEFWVGCDSVHPYWANISCIGTSEATGTHVRPSCHWRDDDRPQMVIQFVRRHDHTWPRLFDFTAKRGIESNEMDLATTDRWAGYCHSHASRSNAVDVDSSRSRSSLRAFMRLAAAAHPVRGWRVAWTTNRPGCA
jgi:hypothetical protein